MLNILLLALHNELLLLLTHRSHVRAMLLLVVMLSLTLELHLLFVSLIHVSYIIVNLNLLLIVNYLVFVF